MQSDQVTIEQPPEPPASALILFRGAARLDVFRLRTDDRLTIGRSPTNRIIVPDPKCSRHHAELFTTNGEWVVRDLGSKNGLTVDGQRVHGDWPLELGQAIQIGECSLKYELSSPELESEEPQPVQGTPYMIIERRTGTQFDRPSPAPASTKQFIDLIQLARAMHDAADVADLVDCALDGLTHACPADKGVILLSGDSLRDATPDNLAVAGTIGIPETDSSGQRPESSSSTLTEIVLSDRQALLVHDVQSDATLSQRKSLQDLAVTSAICAPIRHEGNILGVLHLYASDPKRPLGSDHLDFALAVADHLGAVLPTLRRHEAVLHRLEQATSELRELLELETDLIGNSEPLQRVKRSIARVARTDATVLVRGESGVGKELVARAVHFNSERQDGPFVCVNCAALTESLLESELFGHEKGAFTGASNQKPGKFEQAHQGTLFLDEVGEMSPEIQAKFLRVLEGQPFERVGGGKAITVDVRVVTATNRDLEDAVRAGTFRQDLFYRLQVIEILVPPLREHPEDIPALAQHFVDRFARRAATKVRGFNKAAIDVLVDHPWPGNVRELRNVVERAVILSDRQVLTPDDIQLSRLQPIPPLSAPAPARAAPQRESSPVDESEIYVGHETAMSADALWRSYIDQDLTLDDIDQMYIEVVLDKFNWNKSQASRLLGIERTTLDRRLKKYGLRRPRR
ncbi:MAG: sigma 54-interacting transcriptional regulator [Planctomycetaceae bacterium]|nr:sigma 54-interacting transcriptional regulator [Planctomycetaceae bacterium]